VTDLSVSFSYAFATILLVDEMEGNGMGRGARARTAATADLAVTVLGVAGFLGFLLAARMDDANASPFDVMAFVWFFTFGAIKVFLPWLLSKRSASRRAQGRCARSTLTLGTADAGVRSQGLTIHCRQCVGRTAISG
jgi:hypothetical protein